MRSHTIILITLFSIGLQAQTFKGHQIGESTADFLKLEPLLQPKLADCQATAPRELTPEEIKKRYGRKVLSEAEKKHQVLLDTDPDAYGDRCAALMDALLRGSGHINGN